MHKILSMSDLQIEFSFWKCEQNLFDIVPQEAWRSIQANWELSISPDVKAVQTFPSQYNYFIFSPEEGFAADPDEGRPWL